ncbi:MAG TPA: STAS domain-containing protein [Bacteroidota bacterium]|nr:STAS domain-containing protein [Bacteroidota bacterium]
MKFKVTKNGRNTILKLGVKKLDSTVTPELKAEFLILCKPAVTLKLIVDLESVEFCDSSGLSALLIADRTMREHGGSVILVHVNKKVMDLMSISQLDRVFTIEKKLSDALKT